MGTSEYESDLNTRTQKDEALKMRDVDAKPIFEIADIFSVNHNTIRRL